MPAPVRVRSLRVNLSAPAANNLTERGAPAAPLPPGPRCPHGTAYVRLPLADVATGPGRPQGGPSGRGGAPAERPRDADAARLRGAAGSADPRLRRARRTPAAPRRRGRRLARPAPGRAASDGGEEPG